MEIIILISGEERQKYFSSQLVRERRVVRETGGAPLTPRLSPLVTLRTGLMQDHVLTPRHTVTNISHHT